MKIQKYRRSLGRGRLSRNSYNLQSLSSSSSPSFDKPPIKLDLPFGPLSWDKSFKGKDHTVSISKEFKDQFTAHQILKTFYGDLNSHQINSPLINIEERLDVIVYRAGRVHSLFEARLLIRHGFVSVNDLILRNISAPITLGCVLLIKYPHNNLPYGPHPDHLCVKHLDDFSSLVIYKKPINLASIRYPLGFSIGKLLLAHTH